MKFLLGLFVGTVTGVVAILSLTYHRPERVPADVAEAARPFSTSWPEGGLMAISRVDWPPAARVLRDVLDAHDIQRDPYPDSLTRETTA
jgi:hypothetical protein